MQRVKKMVQGNFACFCSCTWLIRLLHQQRCTVCLPHVWEKVYITDVATRVVSCHVISRCAPTWILGAEPQDDRRCTHNLYYKLWDMRITSQPAGLTSALHTHLSEPYTCVTLCSHSNPKLPYHLSDPLIIVDAVAHLEDRKVSWKPHTRDRYLDVQPYNESMCLCECCWVLIINQDYTRDC